MHRKNGIFLLLVEILGFCLQIYVVYISSLQAVALVESTLKLFPNDTSSSITILMSLANVFEHLFIH